MELNYAPQVRLRQPYLIVLLIGFSTTLLAVVALYFLQQYVRADIMTYTYAMIPLGALAVGLVAGSGYGIGSRVTSMKVRGRLLVAALIIQLSAYLAAGYLQFRSHGPLFNATTGQQLSYIKYFHLATINMRWIREKEDSSPVMFQQQAPKPVEDTRLGLEGYLYRGIGIIGFVIGGAIPLGVVAGMPYCKFCERYMRVRTLMRIPASAGTGAFRVKNKIRLDTPEHQQALSNCLNALNESGRLVTYGDMDAFKAHLKKSKAKVRSSVVLTGILKMKYCPNCFQGELIAELVPGPTQTKIKPQNIFTNALSPEAVNAITT